MNFVYKDQYASLKGVNRIATLLNPNKRFFIFI